MNKIFNKVLIAFAAGSISLSSCTDLDETLYLTRPTSLCCSVPLRHNTVI